MTEQEKQIVPAFVAYNEPGYPRREGFKMTFANGYTVSVAFGSGNYGDGQATAEVGVWDAEGTWYKLNDDGYDVIAGWQTPEEVLAIMNRVAQL